MQTGSPLTRVGRIDFLGVVVPGFYMCCAIAFALMAIADTGGTGSAWERMLSFLEPLERWPVAALLLFASYVLGSIPRTVPVNFTDGVCSVFHKAAKDDDSWYGRLINSNFPYVPMLEVSAGELNEQLAFSPKVVAPKQTRSIMSLFDFWKTTLCHESPATFSLVQSLEGRVRWFVGMFWAACTGLLGGLIAAIVSAVRGGASDPWLAPAVAAGLISALVGLFFGARLRFVRGEEANQVFLAYVACMKGRPVLGSTPVIDGGLVSSEAQSTQKK